MSRYPGVVKTDASIVLRVCDECGEYMQAWFDCTDTKRRCAMCVIPWIAENTPDPVEAYHTPDRTMEGQAK